jgi:hypothetical protein
MSFPKFKIYTLESKPEGTVFFELLPRSYDNRCWNSDSLYIDEEVFGLIEQIIIESVSTYDHYAFTELRPKEMQQIIVGLDNLTALLSNDAPEAKGKLGYIFKSTQSQILKEWDRIMAELIILCRELSEWFRTVLQSGGIITILGI